MPPNSIDNDEDKGKGGWAKGLVDESQNKGKPLQTKKKSMREGMDPSLSTKKATRLTGHFLVMHLEIERSGNLVIPWQRLGQTS